MTMKTTVVLGASLSPGRYSYLAVNRLSAAGHPVIALGREAGSIGNIPVLTEYPDKIPDLDTVTLYLNPSNQKEYYDYIISLQPQRIIFNPGTENPELKQLAKSQGIVTEEACTLVMLSLGNY
jgi:predicted CoA-binding protein